MTGERLHASINLSSKNSALLLVKLFVNRPIVEDLGILIRTSFSCALKRLSGSLLFGILKRLANSRTMTRGGQ